MALTFCKDISQERKGGAHSATEKQKKTQENVLSKIPGAPVKALAASRPTV